VPLHRRRRSAHAGIRLVWEREGERTLGHRVANECALAEALHVGRQILGARIAPLGVAFRHAAPASIAAHVAFFDVRPRFGASWEGLELPRELLDRVPRQANPPLAAWLEGQMASALAERAARAAPMTFAERVEQLVEQDLASGEPDLGRVASALGVSNVVGVPARRELGGRRMRVMSSRRKLCPSWDRSEGGFQGPSERHSRWLGPHATT
jgi:Arabinose-binding domain of AraC transcription regulator, N-term